MFWNFWMDMLKARSMQNWNDIREGRILSYWEISLVSVSYNNKWSSAVKFLFSKSSYWNSHPWHNSILDNIKSWTFFQINSQSLPLIFIHAMFSSVSYFIICVHVCMCVFVCLCVWRNSHLCMLLGRLEVDFCMCLTLHLGFGGGCLFVCLLIHGFWLSPQLSD